MFPPHVSAPMFPSPCFHGVNYRIDNSTVKWIRDRNGNITYLYYNGPQRFRLVSQGFSERSSKSINSWRHDPHQPGKAPSLPQHLWSAHGDGKSSLAGETALARVPAATIPERERHKKNRGQSNGLGSCAVVLCLKENSQSQLHLTPSHIRRSSILRPVRTAGRPLE